MVLIGIPGLQWSDIGPSATPNLWRLADQGGTGVLSVKAVGSRTCPGDGWVTVSAGARSAAGDYCDHPVTITPAAGAGAVVAEVPSIRHANAGFGPVGLLGDTVHRSGGCTTAVGTGAALATADSTGHVDAYYQSPTTVPQNAWTHCPVTVVDAGPVNAPTTPTSAPGASNAPASATGSARKGAPTTPTATGDIVPLTATTPRHADSVGRRTDAKDSGRAGLAGAYRVGSGGVFRSGDARQVQAGQVDAVVGGVLARLGAGTTVVVAGVADHDRTPHLRAVIATGADTRGRYLGSDSTRRDDMVILPDLTASLLAGARIKAPPELIGTPLTPDADRPRALADTVHDLASQDVAAQTHRNLLPRFFEAFVIGQILFYGAAAIALRRRKTDHRRRIMAATRLTALAAAAVPVSAYLVNVFPWWHTGHPTFWLVAGIGVADALAVAVAMAGPWRRAILGPGTVIAGLTAAVLGADLLTGSSLQVNSLMGYSPLIGGRYYGMGNIAFAVLATSTLLASAGVAHWLEPLRGRRVAVAAVLAMTITAAVLDSWTAWGSDFGGLIAFVPGLSTTALLVAGRRVSFIKLQLLRATGMALVLGMAYIDYLRPPGRRTHMGRFFAQLVQGDAMPWLERKFTAMAHTFGNLTLMPIVVVAVLFLTLVLYRPSRAGAGGLQLAYERAPMLRAGLSGAFVTALVGGAVNDSGIAVPALTLAVAVPLALAAVVFALVARDDSVATAGP